MNRQIRPITSLALCLLTIVSGCKPTQPFFFREDGNLFGTGDLSHYMDVATELEYPDVHLEVLDEVTAAQRPLTLAHAEDFDIWDLTLEEVTRLTLENSQVIRQLGGRINDNGIGIASATPEILAQNPGATPTTYDPALVESGNGTATGSQFSGTGVEAALAEFDAQLDSSITWQYNDRPQNFGGAIAGGLFASDFRQDLGNFTAGITKATGNGSTFEIRNNTNYEWNNNFGSRAQPSDWLTSFEAAFTQPLLQGAGTQYNRIAGHQSFQESANGFANQIDGVIIARIRHDISLTDFQAGVRDLMREVETAYWDLHFAYRDLEASKIGRDSANETWLKIKALQRAGGQGGEANAEAQARTQFFIFKAQAESNQTTLFRVESNLRYLMGLTVSDGRLIRPVDEPTTAKVDFDWATIHSEAIARRAEIRSQKWQVKRRELELIASRNHLLPRLDAVGRYRWLGAGDELIRSDRNGLRPFEPESNAFEVLTGGDYQEWEMGLQFTLPIGFRRAMSGIRHHELLLARERAVLQDLELTISHQLGHAIRDVDMNLGLTQTHFSGLVSAQDEVEAVEAVYDVGRTTLDQLLDAQRRRAEAETRYYRSLVDYNRAIMEVHYRKGSLLEYNGVYLAEGPWPGKAYFDALRRARQRDASTHLDYGFDRPHVMSHGPIDQFQGASSIAPHQPIPSLAQPEAIQPAIEGVAPTENGQPTEELIPLPQENQINPINNGENDLSSDLKTLPFVDAALPSSTTHLPADVIGGAVQHVLHSEAVGSSRKLEADLLPFPSVPSRQETSERALSPQTPNAGSPTAFRRQQNNQEPLKASSAPYLESAQIYESEAYHTTAETSTNASSGERAER